MLMVFLSLDCIGKPFESITDLIGALHAARATHTRAMLTTPVCIHSAQCTTHATASCACGCRHALLIAPLLTLIRRPARFPRALALGLLEALKAVVRVVFNMAAKVLQAWAKGIAILSLDAEFSSRRLQAITPGLHPGHTLSAP